MIGGGGERTAFREMSDVLVQLYQVCFQLRTVHSLGAFVAHHANRVDSAISFIFIATPIFAVVRRRVVATRGGMVSAFNPVPVTTLAVVVTAIAAVAAPVTTTGCTTCCRGTSPIVGRSTIDRIACTGWHFITEADERVEQSLIRLNTAMHGVQYSQNSNTTRQ